MPRTDPISFSSDFFSFIHSISLVAIGSYSNCDTSLMKFIWIFDWHKLFILIVWMCAYTFAWTDSNYILILSYVWKWSKCWNLKQTPMREQCMHWSRKRLNIFLIRKTTTKRVVVAAAVMRAHKICASF